MGSGHAMARDDHDKNQGFVYVGTNEGGVPGKNAVRAFRRDKNGLLQEIKGSPFYTRGTGVHPTADLTFANLGPFDSDQCMILDKDRDRLFATNSGSDTVAVFNVQSNGSLVHAPHSPYSSFGVNPVSVGLSERKSGTTLVVANKDYDLGRPQVAGTLSNGNYTTFRVNNNGQLTHISGSTVPAGPGNGPNGGIGPGNPTPTQAMISPDGNVAFDANFFGFHVRSFVIRHDGRLEAADSQTIPPPGGSNANHLAIPLGLQVHPKKPILYVGFVLDAAFGVYTYDEAGDLTFVRAVINVGAGPCWILANAKGDRLYVSNNFENSVGVFDLSDPLNPTQIQKVTLAQGKNNAAPFGLALDAKDQFLHVVTQAAATGQVPNLANGLNVLKINKDGTLTVTDFVALPSSDGTRPQGVAAK